MCTSKCSTSLYSSWLCCSLLTLKCLHGLFSYVWKSDLRSPRFLSSPLGRRVQYSMSITFQIALLSPVLTSPSMVIGFCPELDLDCRWMRRRRRPVWSRWKGSCLACGRRTCRWGRTSSEEARTAAGSSAAGWWQSGCRPKERWGGRGNEQEVQEAGTWSGFNIKSIPWHSQSQYTQSCYQKNGCKK